MADKYCMYEADQGSSPETLDPKIQRGDIVCVDCPDSGVCKGTQGQRESIRLQDEKGNQDTLRLILQNPSCVECDGKTGYSFAPEESNGNGDGWW